MPRRAHRSKALPIACLALAAVGALGASGRAKAIGFLTAVGEVPDSEARIETVDGRILTGVVSSRFTNFHGISKISVLAADGAKLRFAASELRQIVAPLPEVYRLGMYGSAFETIEKAVKTDLRQIQIAHEVTFDSVAWPKRGKQVLLQRVNPGFDHAIVVYNHENSKEGTHSLDGIPVFGNEPKGFVVVKRGGEPFKVTKGNYDERFLALFGDCPEMVANRPARERKFRNFADHVLDYDQRCAAPRAAAAAH